MALVDLIPDDATPSLRFAPSAQTRRVYDRNVYMNGAPFTMPPIVEAVGAPVRVAADQVTVYSKPYDAVMLDPTGQDPALAGIWYADVIVSNDPDVAPGDVYVTLSHPSWTARETRIIPVGTSKLCWTDLAVAVPATPEQGHIIFAGGTPVIVLEIDEPLPLGLPTGTLIARPLN